MEVIKTKIPEVLIIKPSIFKDERGYFFESFNQGKYQELGLTHPFVQDNESYSTKNVIRGLHLQLPPFAQGKVARVIKGKVLDIAVDCRPNSKTFGQSVSTILSGTNKHQFWIPRGFAHGFSVLSLSAIFAYKCDNPYSKDSEIGIKFDDPILNLDWQVEHPIVSAKDQTNLSFEEIKDRLKSFTV